MKQGYDVIIVGGGLQGCSTALQLSLRGCKVLVLEKDYVARHASGVNAGGVRRLGRHPAEIPLSVAAMALWNQIAGLVEDDCGFHPVGQIKVAENDQEMESLLARTTRLRGMGFQHEEPIDAPELRRRIPSIAPHCSGALLTRGDGHANPFRTVIAFKRRAAALGVVFREGVAVQTLQHEHSVWTVDTGTEQFQGKVLVNCSGAWADGIAAQMNEQVPLSPEAFMLMVTERSERFLEPVVGAAGRPLSFKQMDNGTLVIGGGYRGRCDRRRNLAGVSLTGLVSSARTVVELFPRMSGVRIVRAWSGIEGVTPDELPIIGPSRTSDNAFHAFGFSGHGFQLGPIVGCILADLILDGKTEHPIDAFRVDRF